MDNENTGIANLDLSLIMHNFAMAAKRLIWIPVLLAAIVTGIVYYRVDKAYVPMYRCKAVFSVKAHYSGITDITSFSNYLDSSTSSMLSATFPYIISSEKAQTMLQQELGTTTLPGSITAVSTADTSLFTLTVISKTPQDAFNVLKAAIAVYPQAASSILGDTQINEINMPLAPPTEPYNDNSAAHDALLAGGVALLIGVAAIFLLSLGRHTIHSAEDLRRAVNLKCLAYIPGIKLKKRTNKSGLTLTVTNPRLDSSYSESIRNLRVKLQKAMAVTGGQILLVTSTLPNEGKSTISTNLALSLASEGKRVILIDGDLRKQSLKAALGIEEASDGLVEILTGTTNNFRLLNVPNSKLLLLSGDKTVERPQLLLDMPRLKQVLDLLRSKLDFIVIDTPPAGILSDAATLAKYADATLYVVRQDLANTAQVQDSVQGLASYGVNLVGCVLNRTLAGTTRYGYSSKYKANYGYTYGYKYSSSYGRKYRNHYAEAERTAEALSEEITGAAFDASDAED